MCLCVLNRRDVSSLYMLHDDTATSQWYLCRSYAFSPFWWDLVLIESNRSSFWWASKRSLFFNITVNFTEYLRLLLKLWAAQCPRLYYYLLVHALHTKKPLPWRESCMSPQNRRMSEFNFRFTEKSDFSPGMKNTGQILEDTHVSSQSSPETLWHTVWWLV